ncbi:MAG: hypothetical protein Q9181_007248, partial [Wetmoreana brouardii]
YESLAVIKQVANGRRLLELGSGNGYWAYMLRRLGVQVDAVDNLQSRYRTLWINDTNVEEGEKYLRAHQGAKDAVLLLVYPIVGTEFTRRVLDAYKGDTICVAGTQNRNGYTAFSNKIVDEYIAAEKPEHKKKVLIPLPSFAGKDEALFIFEKCDGDGRLWNLDSHEFFGGFETRRQWNVSSVRNGNFFPLANQGFLELAGLIDKPLRDFESSAHSRPTTVSVKFVVPLQDSGISRGAAGIAARYLINSVQLALHLWLAIALGSYSIYTGAVLMSCLCLIDILHFVLRYTSTAVFSVPRGSDGKHIPVYHNAPLDVHIITSSWNASHLDVLVGPSILLHALTNIPIRLTKGRLALWLIRLLDVILVVQAATLACSSNGNVPVSQCLGSVLWLFCYFLMLVPARCMNSSVSGLYLEYQRSQTITIPRLGFSKRSAALAFIAKLPVDQREQVGFSWMDGFVPNNKRREDWQHQLQKSSLFPQSEKVDAVSEGIAHLAQEVHAQLEQPSFKDALGQFKSHIHICDGERKRMIVGRQNWAVNLRLSRPATINFLFPCDVQSLAKIQVLAPSCHIELFQVRMGSTQDPEGERLSFKGLPRAAIDAHQILLFRLRKDINARIGYRLEYRLSFGEPYSAISHSWTDRTGAGDSIVVSDLAPWSLCLSPAKLDLLDWLFYVQDIDPEESNLSWTSWYWMDLFCIGQSREDEGLFSKQLQQIPEVFGAAAACLAILASWPCEKAASLPEPAPSTKGIDDASDVEYDALTEWMKQHLTECSCLPLLDAWFTRVWTRQELLYSKKIILITANMWLSPDRKRSPDVWTKPPQYYTPPTVSQGLDELSSCLLVWATRNGRSIRYYTSALIASMARALIRGQLIEDTVISENECNTLQEAALAEWFAFNWSMLLNGSIRYTSHRRDAIISQMLLLPGYRVPNSPWSMSLEAIAGDAVLQFRGLLRAYQLVATIMTLNSSNDAALGGKPIITESFDDKGGLANILHAVGSPTVLPKRFHDRADVGDAADPGLMVYRPDSNPRFKVTDDIDIGERPLEAARHLLGLRPLWARAADFRTTWNVRDCFEEIQTLLLHYRSGDHPPDQPMQLQRALKHCLGRMTNNVCFRIMTIPRRTSPQYSRPYDDDEVDDLEIPRAFLVKVWYEDNGITPHTNVIFGSMEVGQEGEIWGLGAEMGTKFEHGIAMTVRDGGTRREPVACGVLLPTQREAKYKKVLRGLEATDRIIAPLSALNLRRSEER